MNSKAIINHITKWLTDYLEASKQIPGLEGDDFDIYVRFEYLSPDGKSLVYFTEIKELLNDTKRNGSHWETVCLDKLNSKSEYHFVNKE